MPSIAISLKGVAKVYRRSHLGRATLTTAVSGLDLEVSAGEVFGLLGLNGSGKTTTIKMILGLQSATQGTVEVLGRPMPDLETLAKIGYMPEAACLNPALSGREALRLFATLSRIPSAQREKRVDQMLERVGMATGADQRIAEYSKGMLQRISLAQALIHEPELVVMDEPITGLDPLAIKEVRALVLWLKARGKTVLFSSHDISEVEQVCDRIGILSRGKLARVMRHDEWAGRPGGLEDAFAGAVARADGVGELRLV